MLFDFRYKKTCTVTCMKGYLTGLNTITCQSSGVWTVIRAQCVRQIPGSNNPPKAIVLSSHSIPENTAANEIIGRLTTIDGDEDQVFTYSMVEGARGLVGVDNSRGSLVVAGHLDYETQSRYEIRVMSTDSGTPPLSYTQNLTVQILDVNEPPSKYILAVYLGY
jgi:hypothetical protein